MDLTKAVPDSSIQIGFGLTLFICWLMLATDLIWNSLKKLEIEIRKPRFGF